MGLNLLPRVQHMQRSHVSTSRNMPLRNLSPRWGHWHGDDELMQLMQLMQLHLHRLKGDVSRRGPIRPLRVMTAAYVFEM